MMLANSIVVSIILFIFSIILIIVGIVFTISILLIGIGIPILITGVLLLVISALVFIRGAFGSLFSIFRIFNRKKFFSNNAKERSLEKNRKEKIKGKTIDLKEKDGVYKAR